MKHRSLPHRQIWQRTLRKYRRLQVRLEAADTTRLHLKLTRKVRQVAKRLLRLNRRWQLGIATSVLTAWLQVSPPPATAQNIELSSLDGTNGFVLNGIDFRDYSGSSVSSAGDVNGDGVDDLLVGADDADPNSNSSAGETYVVFGRATFPATLELSSLDGSNGFVLNGMDRNDGSGRSVSAAGDVNGDGIDDLLVGASGADPNGNAGAGETYVVFGQATFPATLELSSLDGSNGFVLNGIDADDFSGSSVSVAGDVNGDGWDDLLIGALRADPNGNSSAGETYVVFGQATFPATLELSSLDGSNGFVLNGVDRDDRSGRSVSAAGDVNGDGWDDLLVGALGADPNGNSSAGETYVVFGQATFPTTLELSSLDGSNGFVINGIDAYDRSGSSVSDAGDVNGDGWDDMIIGAYRADPNGNSSAGETYVVFGRSTFPATLELSSLDGSNGFVLKGIDERDYSGGSVSSAGDVNGDGWDDLLVGAWYAVPNGNRSAGETYVVFGRITFPATMELDYLGGDRGFVLEGINAYDYSGRSVSAAGDVNGDGWDDMIIGASGGDPNGNSRAGETYVIFGTPPPGPQPPALLSIIREHPVNEITYVDALTFRATFSEDVRNVTVDDFEVTGTTATLTVTAVTDFVYRLEVSGGDLRDLNGIVGINLATGQDIRDLDGNALLIAEPAIDETYTLDNDNFPPTIELFDLNGNNGFVLNGIDAGDGSGWSVSSAGDVNGDGWDDMIIGASGADPNSNDRAGETYVVFGRVNFPATLELSSLDGSNGFVLNGVDAGDRSGGSVSAAGDINGDGWDDMIIGVYRANSRAGETYVVFGRATFPAAIELSSLDGSNGFVLNGIDADDFSGFSVSAAGDMNGDGWDDMIIGAYRADPNGNSRSGETYVVFGRATFPAAIELSSLDGSNGFMLNGIDEDDRSGRSVNAAGDVNGDGWDDIIIGASNANPNDNYNAGETYVVFGRITFPAVLEFSSLNGINGFVLNGIDADDRSGVSVSFAGDVNGDGWDDLLVGVLYADPNGNSSAGETYVVFGRATFPATLELSSLDGSNGFVLNGIDAEARSGSSVSSAGDINGDGLDDLLVGAPGANPNSNYSAGETYVAFGRSTFPATLELSSLDGSNGFMLNGIDVYDYSGGSVSGAGDVNGDGLDDLLVGAPSANPNGIGGAGETYVVFGVDFQTPIFTSITREIPADETTAADALTFLATFSEGVANVTAEDFEITGTTATLAVTLVTDSTYQLFVSGGDLPSLNGIVGINLAGGQDIRDAAGNALPGAEPATDETYNLENTAPVFVSITRENPVSEVTAADELTFLATFSEGVENVTADDFEVTGTTATLTVTRVTDYTYQLLVSGGDLPDLNGTVGIDLAAGQDIRDMAGNALPDEEPAIDQTYTLNQRPLLINPIADTTQRRSIFGARTLEIDLTGVFEDEDALTFTAISDNNRVVGVLGVNDNILLLRTWFLLGTATITVIAEDTGGGTATDEFRVSVIPIFGSGATAVESIDAAAAPPSPILHPNPTAGKITVKVPGWEGSSADYFLTDADDSEVVLSGQAVLPLELDLSGLPAGTYILTLEHEGKTMTARVVKKS